MDFITLDFETYYDRDYSLSKVTTEEYVRSEQFEVIGVSVKLNSEPAEWFSGSHKDVADWLANFDWGNAFVLAHNMLFDGAILSWRFDIHPKVLLDTLCMLRAIDGTEVGNSLAKASERYNLGVKGTEVIAALGKRRVNFSEKDLWQYGEYCKNDVELTYKLFDILQSHFNKQELRLIDITLRMFCEPVLHLDLPLLEQHYVNVKDRKDQLLRDANADRETLMSNQKFAERLNQLGVDVPMKVSPTTGKPSFALAKNDDGFKALAEHPDERVQALVAARLGSKSTLEETRTERFINIAKRGVLPVPLRYYAAHTGRWGGDDKLNLQNLPRKSLLKEAIIPPSGYTFIDADSSQIEARIVAWLSGQNDLVALFESGSDVYKKMASVIYRKEIDAVNEQERFVGKTTILGAGYGMGWSKFQSQLRTFGISISEEEARYILRAYRDHYPHIPKLWQAGDKVLEALSDTQTLKTTEFGYQPQAVYLLPGIGLDLPSGLQLRYLGLHKYVFDGRPQYAYKTRSSDINIYGGKVVENVCQALARCVVGEQMLRIAKRYRVVLTVHDAVSCIVKHSEADEAALYVQECMRWRPEWAKTLPLNCEVKVGPSYGGTKKWTQK